MGPLLASAMPIVVACVACDHDLAVGWDYALVMARWASMSWIWRSVTAVHGKDRGLGLRAVNVCV